MRFLYVLLTLPVVLLFVFNYLPMYGEYEEDLGVVLPPESVKTATVLVTVGPIIFLYPVIQRHFIKGTMLGSLKG